MAISWLLLYFAPGNIGLKAPQYGTIGLEPLNYDGALSHASVLHRQSPPRYAATRLCIEDNTTHN